MPLHVRKAPRKLHDEIRATPIRERPDPKADAIVPVEAGRLRGKLKEYYAVQGSGDPVWIDLPRGTYVPVFTAQSAKEGEDTAVPLARQRVGNVSGDAPAGTRPRSFRRWAPAFMLAALVALAAAA